MIIVSSSDKPFTYTAKGTARRKAVIKDYQPEIDALYEQVDKLAETDGPMIQNWDYDTALDVVRKVVSGVLEKTLNDDDELFQHGCDRFVVSS